MPHDKFGDLVIFYLLDFLIFDVSGFYCKVADKASLPRTHSSPYEYSEYSYPVEIFDEIRSDALILLQNLAELVVLDGEVADGRGSSPLRRGARDLLLARTPVAEK